MKLIKKLLYSLLISLSIHCMNSMQNDIEAQLIHGNEDYIEERDVSLDLVHKPRLLSTIFSWIPFCNKNSFNKEEDAIEDIEAPLLFHEDTQEARFSIDLLEELPKEIIEYIFSYIQLQDKGLHNFLRHIGSIEESPYDCIAQDLTKHYYNYRKKQLQPDCNAKATKKGVPCKALVALSFMATVKDTHYSWHEGSLLNQLIPRYKRIVDFPSYKIIERAWKDYCKEISDELKLLQSEDKNLARQYISDQIIILNSFLRRLKEYSDFITVKEVKVSCGATCQCNLGSVDFSEPMDFYSIMAGTGCLASSVAAIWLLAPIAWYYPAALGCSGSGCIIVPCYLNGLLTNENKKNKKTFRAINKAINLISHVTLQLYTLQESIKKITAEITQEIIEE